MQKILSFTFGIIIGLSLSALMIFIVLPYYQHQSNSVSNPIYEALELTSDESEEHKQLTMGFIPYWLLNKQEPENLKKINFFIYFGLLIGTDGHLVTHNAPGELDPGYAKLKSPELAEIINMAHQQKSTLSLAVYLQDEDLIPLLLTAPSTYAQNLIADVEPIMREYGFTDLNLDIESFRTTTPEARANFTTFVRTLKSEIENKNLGTLSLDLAPRAAIDYYIFDPLALGEIVDHVILMTYDYNVRSSPLTGPVAPLNGYHEVRNFDVTVSLAQIKKLIPSHKLILGVPLYGYQWDTISSQPHQPIIPRSGETASERRISEILNDCSNCISGFDEISQEAYLIVPGSNPSTYIQIFYGNQKSLQKKIELVEKEELGGLAFWALGYESVNFLQDLTD